MDVGKVNQLERHQGLPTSIAVIRSDWKQIYNGCILWHGVLCVRINLLALGGNERLCWHMSTR